MQVIKVPQLAWHNPRELEISLPDDWLIEIPYMSGHSRLELTPEKIREALNNPIGTCSLRELAAGKKEVAIVFDDLTRITRTAKIVPHILAELAQASIEDDNIRLICALGLHSPLDRSDFVKKLGGDVVSRFRVFNHNAFGNCVYVGTTPTFKTRVHLNQEYFKCDLKIAIGSCVPHPAAGFAGGSKLILPGIASFETIEWNHRMGGVSMDPLDTGNKPTQGMGIVEKNALKKDMDDASDIAGPDFLINVIGNLWGDTVAIYAGERQQSYIAAVQDAKAHYRSPKILDKNVVISNSYAKASECLLSLSTAVPMVSQKGGDIVVIANAPDGQVTHYLVGAFGKTTYASQFKEPVIPPYVNNVIIYNEYPHRGSSWFGENPKIKYISKWNGVLEALNKIHGAGTKAAVIPDATNQYFAWYD